MMKCSAERQLYVESLPEGSAFPGSSPLVVSQPEKRGVYGQWEQGEPGTYIRQLFLVETQLCHPRKDVTWEIFLGMCDCAENVFELQTRGNGVTIWCGKCSSHKHSSRNIFLFHFPLWIQMQKYLSLGCDWLGVRRAGWGEGGHYQSGLAK